MSDFAEGASTNKIGPECYGKHMDEVKKKQNKNSQKRDEESSEWNQT